MNRDITFDTGALIALERRGQRIAKIFLDATERRAKITVPSVVVVEWWRGRTDARERILRGLLIEPLTDALAKAAGEALADVTDATPVDAVVMASAATRGDLVYTSDVADLERLRKRFPGVRVLQA